MLINFDKFIAKPNILNKILKKKNKPKKGNRCSKEFNFVNIRKKIVY